MKRGLQLAYWDGYSEGITGITLAVMGASRKWEYEYKRGQRDGLEDRAKIQRDEFSLPRNPEAVHVP